MLRHHQHQHQGRLLSLLILVSCCMTAFSRHLEAEDINVKLIGTIESYMDDKANPCEHFYQYACGNWENRREVNAKNLTYVDTISTLEYTCDLKVEQILDNADSNIKFQTDEVYGKIRDFYESCKQHTTKNGTRYLDIIKPTDSDNWPQFDEPWNPQEPWNIWSTLGKLAAVGFNDWLFTFDVNQQVDRSYRPTLNKVDQDTIELRQMFTQDSTADRDPIKAASISEFLIKFYYMDQEHGKDGAEVTMTISEFHQQIEHIDLYAYLKAFFGHEEFSNITVTVKNLDYLRAVADAVRTASHDVLIQSIKYAFLYYLKTPTSGQKGKQTCVHTMRRLVPSALEYLYEKEVYSHERQNTDAVIEKVFKSMQLKFVEIIEEHSDEYSPVEIEALQEKILKMNLNIGNFPTGVDDQFIADYFSTWVVVKGDFYRNHLNALKRRYHDYYEIMKLDKYSPLYAMTTLTTASPLYKRRLNIVIIPHSYIRYPMVHPEFHELFLYAELGNSVGHEIMHGYDLNGLKYDAVGNFSKFNITEKPKFKAALECLQQQKTSAINEKLADFSGFRLAYETHFHQSKVPEFSGQTVFSNKQLFFIKFAQLFCSVDAHSIRYDNSHDTPFARVPQVVSNSPDFAEAFSCTQKTDEPIVEKCNLW